MPIVRKIGCSVSGLAGAAMTALVIASAPAFAQEGLDGLVGPEQEAEIYCVYDILSQSGDTLQIADVFVDPDASEAAIEAADATLSGAVDECMAAYVWDETTREYAAAVGIHASVIEVVVGRMTDEGLEQSLIKAIFGVLDVLEAEDMATFRSPDWLSNARFQKRMNRSLVLAGLPNESSVLDNALLVMESAALSVEAIVDWLLADAPATADASKALGGSKKSKSASAEPAPRAPKLTLTSTGTGWYVADGGLIVTNAHVIEGCKRITLKSGADLSLINVAADGEDLALLRGSSSVRPLNIRDTRSVRLAEDVLIAGFPLGSILSSGINVTVGTVSAQMGMGDDKRRFQFTAPVQPGNSGGPVLDMSGNVIGVVVSKLNAMSVQDKFGDIPQNVNFGITLAQLIAFLDANDVAYQRTASADKLDKVDLAELARASTVLLQCYE